MKNSSSDEAAGAQMKRSESDALLRNECPLSNQRVGGNVLHP